jgi:hypothetical protein
VLTVPCRAKLGCGAALVAAVAFVGCGRVVYEPRSGAFGGAGGADGQGTDQGAQSGGEQTSSNHAVGGSSPAPGGSTGAAGLDPEQCQLVDVSATCDGCSSFESLGLRCRQWTRLLVITGDRLLLSRQFYPERVELLEVRSGPSVLWRHDLGYGEVPTLSSDGQLATLSTWHSADSTLHIWPEASGFEEHSFELAAEPTGLGVAGDRLHLLVPQEPGLSHLAGPFTGPLQLVQEVALEVSLLDLDPVKLLHREATGDGGLLWTEYHGIRHELAVPSATTWSVLDTPDGLVGMQDAPGGGLDLRTASQAWHLGTETVPAACTGFQIVDYPDICPSETIPQGQRVDVVLSARLVADDAGVAWLAVVVGDVSETCVWQATRGCFETLPCDCRQVLQVQVGRAELRLQPLLDSARVARVGLASLASRPHLAIRFRGGQFVVAVADAASDETTLRYFVIQPE